MFKKTVPLALALGLASLDGAYCSNSNFDQEPSKPTSGVNYENLKAENAALRTQMEKMQATFAAMMQNVQAQADKIAEAEKSQIDPKIIEREAVKRLVKGIFVNAPKLKGEGSSDDEGDGPPLNHNFLYVDNFLADLAHFRNLAWQPFLDDLTKTQVNQEICELERLLGITQAREEEARKKREEERRKEEEERLRLEQAILDLKAENQELYRMLEAEEAKQEKWKNEHRQSQQKKHATNYNYG